MSTDTEPDTRCGYRENDRDCRADPYLEIPIDGKLVKLCKRHLRPEFHPADIRKKLPGKIETALRRLAAR